MIGTGGAGSRWALTTSVTASGGNYTLYLEASSNALLASTSAGSFYAFDIENPTLRNDLERVVAADRANRSE